MREELSGLPLFVSLLRPSCIGRLRGALATFCGGHFRGSGMAALEAPQAAQGNGYRILSPVSLGALNQPHDGIKRRLVGVPGSVLFRLYFA